MIFNNFKNKYNYGSTEKKALDHKRQINHRKATNAFLIFKFRELGGCLFM